MVHTRNAIGRFYIPMAPQSIQKGSTLKDLLDQEAIGCLVHNISLVYSSFDGKSFQKTAMNGLTPLGIIDGGHHLARAFLSKIYT